MSYVLVCSPSGTGVKDVLSKLAQRSGPNDIVTRDIERVLCESWKARDRLTQAGAPANSPSMLDITWNLSRSTIADLWEDAAKQCVSEIISSKKGVKVICCNLVYYGRRRDEFYSVVNPQVLISSGDNSKPSHVVLFIDDVYDMYLRLSGRGEIFDLTACTLDFYRRVENDEGVRIRQLSRQRLCNFFLEAQLAMMTRILTWRNTETIMAENLAFQYGAKFMCWGVKQLSDIIASWIVEPNAKSVYLSHPIARPRQKQRVEGNWPDVTADFNTLQRELFEKSLLCVMPTAIDELRIKRAVNRRQAQLEERWPLPSGNVENVLYCYPEGTTDMNHIELIAPQYWDFKEQQIVRASTVKTNVQCETLLRVFEKEIEAQTSARDHLLVSHTDGILVFRPLVWEGVFSSGVEAEIVHWEGLAKAEPTRRAVFIHFDEDVRVLFDNYQQYLERDIDFWMAQVLAERSRMQIDKAKQVIDWIQERKGGVLDRGPLPTRELQKVTADLEHIKREARVQLVCEKLTHGVGVGTHSSQVGLWIVRDMDELRTSHDEIAEFLLSGKQPNKSWQNRVDNLLPYNKK